jgi:two-component sensor histidine kinase
MKKLILLFIFIVAYTHAAVGIDDNKSKIELLPYSLIYKDYTKKLSIEEVQTKSDAFAKVESGRLSFGYSPDFNVWLQVTLHNKSDKKIDKIIEYANPLTTHIDFFDISKGDISKDGLFQINTDRKTVNPYFQISLEPNEIKTYYIKVSSKITTLIIELNLWNTQEFYNKELAHQSVLQLFFGAMLILAFYNIFIYFFTRDVSYLFYVLYILGIVVHHLMYSGISYIYLLNTENIGYFIESATFIVAFPIFTLGLFIKYFIKLKQYPLLNKLLNIYLFLFPFLISLFIFTHSFDKFRNIFTVILLIYLIYIAIYTAMKGNRQSYFIVGGWIIMFIGSISMYLSSIGIYNIYQYFPYIVELTFITEALFFSIALSDKINQLQYEKNMADKELIKQQILIKQRLVTEVENKTQELKGALEIQTTLLKELNHRVKNNMQTIISLVRLQADEVEDENMQNIFVTIQNRINAMSYLHELLYKQSDISHVNIHEYFDNLIGGLQDSYDNESEIIYDIQVNLEVESAISCGLILNELVTNSFKYAFLNQKGDIWIALYKKEKTFYLTIEDDGVGYNLNQTKHSFGLVLVKTLVENHLKGTITTTANDSGVKNQIIWSSDD